MSLYIVAVHGGAGSHTASSERSVKHALRVACSRSLHSLERGEPSVRAVEDAICVLEDDESLNAGFGSNLTITGNVECDASIMEGTTRGFGSVGAVAGVKNPISLARAILENASKPHHLGRVPPLTLVSHGGYSFAAASDLPLVSPADQVSYQAKLDWERWKTRLEEARSAGMTKEVVDCPSNISDRQDTVGAIACNLDGSMASGVSSGGLLLKYPGRIGEDNEAAAFGAGCWAHSPRSETRASACSISGTGEHIIRSSLSRTLTEMLQSSPPEDTHDVLQKVLVEQFCPRAGAEANAGILLLTKEPSEHGQPIYRLWCAFTTTSMAIGYASSLDPKPKAKILRRPGNKKGGDGPQYYVESLPITGI